MWKRMASALFVSLFLVGADLRVCPGQNPETQTFRLNKLDVNGLQKISREKFVEVSGLRLGQSVKFADLKIVANKLYESGLFASVKYRYSWDGDKLDVTFDIEESKPPEPGPAPAAPKTPVLGKIEFSGLQRCDQATAVNALGLQLGAAIDQKQLNAATKRLGEPIMNLEYSGQQFAKRIENTLLPIYRRRGYLQAKFGDVSAQPDAGANKKCKGGVNVSAQVVEGAVYKLGKFEWVGNQALEMETIQDLFRMKAGATADGAKIDKGLNAIKTAYLKQGYLDLKMTVETNFDESARVANYHIVVEEGKPYQMGEVLIKNASEDEEKRIRGKWQMAQGAVFNVEYVRGFIKKMFDDRSGRTPRVRLQPDRTKQIANVLFTY